MPRPVVNAAATMPALPAKPPRLRYIDMARALAILLMLEGHFVHLVLAPEWRVEGHWIYEVWLHARGLAAPMFFTVTGLIFAFLLSGSDPQLPFFAVRRVRRGLLRVLELVGWGYLLQFHPRLLGGAPIPADSWFLTFHVFQCIACGLLVMIAIYGVLRRAPRPCLAATFALTGFALHLISIPLANVDGYLPVGWPAILQNPFKGPGSHFPLSPWLGFTLYGAAIGTAVRHRQHGPRPAIHPCWFLLPGAVLAYRGWKLDGHTSRLLLDALGITGPDRQLQVFFHGRFGETLIALGLLVALDKTLKLDTSRLETIGRNTFPIYIGHVIVLYGGIFGIGLQGWQHSFSPWPAAIGALLFCAAFAALAQGIEPAQTWLQARLARIRGQAAQS